jgi:hypothetical protein
MMRLKTIEMIGKVYSEKIGAQLTVIKEGGLTPSKAAYCALLPRR